MDQEEELLKEKLRKTSRQLWREYPNLSFDEMVDQYDVKEITREQHNYDREQLKILLMPHLTAEEEWPILKVKKFWTLGDAAALWLDINPFIFHQAFQQGNPSFYNMPILLGLRDSWMQLRDQAFQAALLDELETIKDNEQRLVKPRDFYEWAISQTGGPSGRAEKCFAELMLAWNEDDLKINPPQSPKPPSKVDIKRAEIMRILELIKSVDQEFDSQSMHGRRADFQKLCIHVNKKMFSVAEETFNDYLPGLCAFNSGARETDYYSKIAEKLG